MKPKIATLLITLMGLALLGFTALRTLDLIQLTLPADQQTYGYLALVAFDGGLLGWTLFFLFGARGPWQRAIAACMIVVSLAGVLIAFGADTLYQANARGTLTRLDPAVVATAIWAMVVIIGLNIAAVTGLHLASPDARRARAEEEAQDKIDEAALAQIAENADSLAAEIAPARGQAWVASMRARYHTGVGDPLPPPGSNGHREPVATGGALAERPAAVPVPKGKS